MRSAGTSLRCWTHGSGIVSVPVLSKITMSASAMSLDGIARVDDQAGAEQRAGRDNLDRGNGQRERARTGDDQYRNRNDDSVVQRGAGRQPSDRGQCRRGMDDGGVEACSAVSQTDIPRLRLNCPFQEPLDFVDQRRVACGRHFQRQRPGEIHTAGIDRGASCDDAPRGFAGHEAFIDLRRAIDPRPHQPGRDHRDAPGRGLQHTTPRPARSRLRSIEPIRHLGL